MFKGIRAQRLRDFRLAPASYSIQSHGRPDRRPCGWLDGGIQQVKPAQKTTPLGISAGCHLHFPGCILGGARQGLLASAFPRNAGSGAFLSTLRVASACFTSPGEALRTRRLGQLLEHTSLYFRAKVDSNISSFGCFGRHLPGSCASMIASKSATSRSVELGYNRTVVCH